MSNILAPLLVLYKALPNQVRFRDSVSYTYLHSRRENQLIFITYIWQSLYEKGLPNISKTKVL